MYFKVILGKIIKLIVFRVIMHCTYKGFFEEKHKIKKRRMIGPAKENAVMSLIAYNKSSETYREIEANRLVKIGIY